MVKAKTKNNKRRHSAPSIRYKDRYVEADGIYFLKLVVVVLLGTFWLKFSDPLFWNGIPLGAFPLGLLIGLILIRLLEKNAVDRKIWFAVIIIVAIICYNAPSGIVI